MVLSKHLKGLQEISMTELKPSTACCHNDGLNVAAYEESINQATTSALVKVNHTITTTSPVWRPSKDNLSGEYSQLLHLGKQCLSRSTPLQYVCDYIRVCGSTPKYCEGTDPTVTM